MKTLKISRTILVILSFFAFYSCNNPEASTDSKNANDNEQPEVTKVNRALLQISPRTEDGYFTIDKIIEKGMIAFSHIDYEQNKIKIAIPSYSESDAIEVDTSTVKSTLVISINVPDNSDPFAYTTYFEVGVKDINQWNNFEIQIKSDAQPLSTQIIERESLTQPPATYDVEVENLEVETFDIPQHFYDNFKDDGLISIFTIDSLRQIEFFSFPYYEPNNNSVTLDSTENYLFINVNENGSSPLDVPKINYYTITINSELNKKGKIKVINNRKNRKTIARTPNRKLDNKDE